MEKRDDMPMWVFLALSSINTRKGALILIWSCIIFTFYCIPWVQFFPEPEWLGKVLLIDDWSWLAMMVPMVIWYWLSLRWIDKNNAWQES